MTEQQAKYLVKRESLNTSWDNFLNAMKVVNVLYGLHDYVLDYTKKNLPSLKFSNLKPYLFISQNDGVIIYALNAIQSFKLEEFNKKEFIEPFLEFIKTENRTMNFYIEKIKKRILDEENKKDIANKKTQSPNLKKTQFKDEVLNKLHLVEDAGLKEILVWQPDSIMKWIKDLDKYTVETIFDGIKRWGNESNIEMGGISLIKEIYLLNKKTEQEGNFQKVMEEVDGGRKRDIFRSMPKASGIIYRIFMNWILLHRDFNKAELIPLIQKSTNATSAYLDYAIECMTKEHIKLTETEAKEFREKISPEIRDRLRIDEWIKKTLVDAASKQEVKTGTKPKMNIKENQEYYDLKKGNMDLDWKQFLTLINKAIPFNIGYSEMEEQLRTYFKDYLDSHIEELELKDLLPFKESAARPMGLFSIMMMNVAQHTSREFKNELWGKNKELKIAKDYEGFDVTPVKRFLAYTLDVVKRERGSKEASDSETAKPKARKLNIKESKETWANKLADFENRMDEVSQNIVEYRQAAHEATNFAIKNLRYCTVEDFIDMGYCYTLMARPSFTNNVAGTLSTLKPEVKKEILEIKKEDEPGISDTFWYFQRQIRKEEGKETAVKSNTITPKVKKTSFKENKFERMFDYLNEETNG